MTPPAKVCVLALVVFILACVAFLATQIRHTNDDLHRSTEVTDVWGFVNENEFVGACQKGHSVVPDIPQNYCTELYCLRSPVTGENIDVSVKPFHKLLSDSSCSSPYGGHLPTNGSIEVSFILALHNNAELASKAILELFRTAREARSVEFVVVDDYSSKSIALVERLLENIQRYFGIRVTLIWLRQPCGFGAANTAGIKAAIGKYIALINTDMYVINGWLSSLLLTFKTANAVGLVGPLFIGDNNLVTEAGGIVLRDATAANYGRGLSTSPDVLYMRNVDYVSAACVLMRRKLFNEIGGFDHTFGKGYFEDTDLAMTIRKNGYNVIMQPTSLVYHQEGHTLGTDESPLKKRLMAENKDKFLTKWRQTLGKEHLAGVPVLSAEKQRYRIKILWIDDIVPETDSDSGSIRTLELLRALVDNGYHVTYQPNAGGRRSEYVVRARAFGVHVTAPTAPSTWTLNSTTGGCLYDGIVVARRYVFDGCFKVVKDSCPGVPVIYDTVDLHFLRESRDVLSKTNTGKLDADRICRWLEESQTHEAEIIRKGRSLELSFIDFARVTIVVSSLEVQVLKRLRPTAKVFIVSNVHRLKQTKTPCEDRRGALFVGNFNHPPNLQGIKWFVSEVLPHVSSLLPDDSKEKFTFNIVGANNQQHIKEFLATVNTRHVHFHGHASQDQLDHLYSSVRLVVAPLLSGAGVKGKVNQAMSYGVPVVATSIAVEGMGLTNNTDCLVGDTDIEFARAVAHVLQSCTVWRQLARGGYANIEEYFSPTVARSRLFSAFAAAGVV